jgi:hypothetical protein
LSQEAAVSQGFFFLGGFVRQDTDFQGISFCFTFGKRFVPFAIVAVWSGPEDFNGHGLRYRVEIDIEGRSPFYISHPKSTGYIILATEILLNPNGQV